MNHFPPHPALRAGFVRLPHTHTYLATGLLAGSTVPLLQWLQSPVIPLTCKPGSGSGSEVSQQRLVGTVKAAAAGRSWQAPTAPAQSLPGTATEPAPTLFLLSSAQFFRAGSEATNLGFAVLTQLWLGPDSLKPLLLGPGPHSQSTQTH